MDQDRKGKVKAKREGREMTNHKEPWEHSRRKQRWNKGKARRGFREHTRKGERESIRDTNEFFQEKKIEKETDCNKKCIMIGFTYGQQAYKLLNIEHRTILSSHHVTFDESGTISRVESAPWNAPAVEGQWKGLVPEHLHKLEDDHHHHHRPVGVIPPSNPRPVGDIPAPVEIICLASPDIEELTDRLDQHCLNPAPAPAPPPAPCAPTLELPPAPAPVAAPAQIIAGVRQSGRQRQPANKNREYQRALDEEATQRTSHNAPSRSPSPEPAPAPPDLIPEPPENDPEIPGALTASIEDFIFTGSANSASNKLLPNTLKEAYSRMNAEFWKSAVGGELQSLNSNHVYETVLIPDEVTPITSKPVFQIKHDQTRNIERYKVRIIACDFTKKEGVDYEEVFTPVANLDSVWTLIALAAKHNLKLDQMDVSTAYLNGA